MKSFGETFKNVRGSRSGGVMRVPGRPELMRNRLASEVSFFTKMIYLISLLVLVPNIALVLYELGLIDKEVYLTFSIMFFGIWLLLFVDILTKGMVSEVYGR